MKTKQTIWLCLLLSGFCLTAPAQTENNAAVTEIQQKSEVLLVEDPRQAYAYLKTKTDSLLSEKNYMAVARLSYYRANALLKFSATQQAIGELLRLEKILAEEVPDSEAYLVFLSDFSWLLNDLGQIKAATAKDSLVLDIREKNPPQDPLKIGKAQYNMGYNYLMLGDLGKSRDFFMQALKNYKKGENTPPKHMMDAYNAIGSVNLHMEHTAEAEKNFLDALFYCDSVDDPETDKYRPSVQNNLAILYEDQGNLQDALDLFSQAANSAEKVLSSEGLPDYQRQNFLTLLSKIQSNTGAIYFEIGDYGKAERLYQLVLRERQKRLEPGHSDLNRIYNNLGRIYLQNENEKLSREYFQKAIDGCEHNFGRNSYWSALAYADMASLDAYTGDFENAHRWYDQALEIVNHLDEDEDVSAYKAQLYVYQADLYESEKNYSAALTSSKLAYNRYQTGRGINSPRSIQLLVQTGRLYFQQGDYAEAQKMLDQAKNQITAYSNRKETSLSLQHLIPEVYYLQSKISLANEPHNLKKALEILEIGIDALEGSKNIYSGSDSKLLLYEANKSLFDLAESLSARLYKAGEKEYLDTLLQFAEKNKTILIRHKLNTFRAIKYSSIPDSIIIKEHSLIEALSGVPLMDTTMNDVDYNESYTEYLKLVSYIRKHYPHYYALQYAKPELSLGQIQTELLPENATLIYYIYSDSSLYAVVVDQNQKTFYELSSSGHAEAITKMFEQAKTGDSEGYYKTGNKLYRQLILPLEKTIKNKNVLIVPDGPLHALNFEALPKSREGRSFAEMQYLLNDYTISYYLSADAAFKYNKIRQTGNTKVLAFAPEFTDTMKLAYRKNIEETSPDFDTQYLYMLRQPFAAHTADALQAQYAGLTFKNFGANEDNFKKNCSDYGIIHLGTHAELNNTSPLLSRLVFAKSEQNDGYLHAYEIYNLPLRAELVVLTACQTGSGKIKNGEGVISLAHSFAFAGCPSLIMSLWQIDEKTTSIIIDEFYKNLSNGMSKSEALAMAKRSYFSDATGEMANPYYWAGMVLLGNTDPVIPEQKSKPFFWILIGAVLVCGGIAWYSQQRKKPA